MKDFFFLLFCDLFSFDGMFNHFGNLIVYWFKQNKTLIIYADKSFVWRTDFFSRLFTLHFVCIMNMNTIIFAWIWLFNFCVEIAFFTISVPMNGSLSVFFFCLLKINLDTNKISVLIFLLNFIYFFFLSFVFNALVFNFIYYRGLRISLYYIFIYTYTV